MIDEKIKFSNPVFLKTVLIILSFAALFGGILMGTQIFQELGEFKKLGIFIIIGAIIGAAILVALVRIFNDLTYIKNKLSEKDLK
jgi:uncharacterized membrane protein YeaQ/YmgE (transglycosylase-associated protein family)